MFPAVTETITVCPEAHHFWTTTPALLPKLKRGKENVCGQQTFFCSMGA